MFDKTIDVFKSSFFCSKSPYIAAVLATLAGSLYFYFYGRKKTKSTTPIVDLQKQSVVLPGPEGVRTSAIPLDQIRKVPDDVTSIHGAFARGVKLAGDKQCLGTPIGNGQYKWLTYQQVFTKAKNVGSGLVHLGFSACQDSRIGICAANCAEWVVAEHGCYMYSMVVVPVYETYGPSACAHIINETSIRVLFCDSKKLSIILDMLEHCPTLKYIVKISGNIEEDERSRAKDVKLFSFEELEEMGISHPHEFKLPTPDDLFTICYTSGTTGPPKGAMLTHGNMVATLQGLINATEESSGLNCEDMYLSFLPLAHMYERTAQVYLLLCGVRIAFWSGDAKNLLQDLQLVRPTLFFGVPRLFNRIYDKVMAGVKTASPLKRALFNKAIQSKEYEIKVLNIIRNDSIWDFLVFKKIQNIFGGRVRMLSCGSAPLSADVLNFFRCTMGCKFYEGYGQTEVTCGATFQIIGDYHGGHVGPPVVNMKAKLVDVPEKNYHTINNQGEICLKGPQVFKGYFKNPEKTAEALDEDDWLHTGDIGEWTKEGTLKIIDRKKNIFKLSQGEYVAPERIENIYLRSSFVAQVFVHGDSLQWCTVAIAVPDEEVLQSWAKKNGVPGDLQTLCQSEEVKKLIFEDMVEEGKRECLKSFEQIKDVFLSPHAFTLEDGLVTPTFKIKRGAVQKKFSEKIASMYKNINKS